MIGFAVVVLALGMSAARAQASGAAASDTIFLLQLVVLMLTGRLLGEAMRRIGQPSVMGQLLAGVLLGHAALGWLWPDFQRLIFPASEAQRAMLDGISQFGILLLLLLTGMEVDLSLARRIGRAAISTSLTGVAVPFTCGIITGLYLPESLLPDESKRLITSLFLGTALSISSIKIVATVVREMNFTRRNLGQLIVTSAILDDTIGWIIIAVTFSLARAETVDFASVSKSLIGTAVFLIASFAVGRRLVFYLIRWANDNFESEYAVVTMILVIMGISALATQALGVHTVLGAFIAGVMIGDSPILTRQIDEQLRGLIMAFFMPVFFATAGLNTDLTALKNPELLLLAVVMIAIASIGKFGGALTGGALGGLNRREAIALACGMNARGSTEIVVASIGLSMGALSENLFTIIVLMAVVTTMAMPPMLRWALARVPLTDAEKARLEREDAEAKAFVPKLERLLVAADESANGRLASRLAGLLAGPRGMALTFLKLPQTRQSRDEAAAEPIEQTMKAAGDKSKQHSSDAAPEVPVTIREIDEPFEDAIAAEAKKGYGLFFIGMENARAKGGGFHPALVRIASAFEGPLAIVAANGVQGKEPDRGPLHILVPFDGTEVSQRAAEVAIHAARATEATLTVMYVSNPKASWRQRRRGELLARRQERGLLDHVVELASRYDQKIRTHVERGPASKAILSRAARGDHNLIVMGISRRPGQRLFFGDTATAVFEAAPISVVFLWS